MRGFGTEELVACYERGVFPMSEGRDDPSIFLIDPDERGVIPLDAFHIPKSLAKTVRRDAFDELVGRGVSIERFGLEPPGRCEAAVPQLHVAIGREHRECLEQAVERRGTGAQQRVAPP